MKNVNDFVIYLQGYSDVESYDLKEIQKILDCYDISWEENFQTIIRIIRSWAKLEQRLEIALELLITKDIFDENHKKRPYLELEFWIDNTLRQQCRLTDSHLLFIKFLILKTYDFPCIVGSPWNIYKINFNKKSEKNILKINEINSTPYGKVNTADFISQTKGGLSVDLGFGCPIGCLYCYRVDGNREDYSKRWTPDFPRSTHEVISELLEHPWFTPHVTPIGLLMSTTEAFAPKIKTLTFEMLEQLEYLKLTNRVTLISKYWLSDEEIKRIDSYKYLDIDISVTFSNMPKRVEPQSGERRADFAKRLVQNSKNINILGYIRPIIDGLNSSPDSIKTVLSVFKDANVETLVFGGIKLSEEHLAVFEEKGIDIEKLYDTNGRKHLPKETVKNFYDIYSKVNENPKEINLYRRSSCGRVAARGTIPDYNCHYFFNKEVPGCIQHNCKMYDICYSTKYVMDERIEALLERLFHNEQIEHIQTDKYIIIKTELTKYERSFLMQNLLKPVITEKEYLKWSVQNDNRL
ncbi:TPA: hypothetical protein U1366_000054 [Streptococcus suis]|nr:hypothetical protein [Streptococcus suis]HEM5299412.1 hypothetical protein [Streptococcus suis]